MAQFNLALVGFGNVGQALVQLLRQKSDLLSRQYGITFQVTGIATGRHGMIIDPSAIDLERALMLAARNEPLTALHTTAPLTSVMDFIHAVPAQVLFENSPVNALTGQPAIDHLRAALGRGMHAITANKGPVAHAYHELSALAKHQNRRFLFESTVMDGAPIFSLFREPLPAIHMTGFQGILNSCTNLLIGLMEQGQDFNQAVAYAQSIGIAETDPSADIDGWDAAVKISALTSVLMALSLKPQHVHRVSMRTITPEQIISARQVGKRWKMVCTAQREGEVVVGRVEPQLVAPDSPLFAINGTSSYVQFATDVLPGLGIVENNPGPNTTAYGLLADFINAVTR